MSDQSLHRNLIVRVNLGDLLVRSAVRAPRQLVTSGLAPAALANRS